MQPIIQANLYLFEGIAISLFSCVFLILGRIKKIRNFSLISSLILCTFAFWCYYLHLKNFNLSDIVVLFLSSTPFIVIGMYLGRNSIKTFFQKIGKFKWNDFEVEFDRAGSRLKNEVFPVLTVDEIVFSRKQSIHALQREVSDAIRKLSWLPINKRTLFLSVDFGKQYEGDGIDAASLYFYIIVLREAASKTLAKFNGILFYATEGNSRNFLGVVLASEYIEVFERTYPQIRDRINLHTVSVLVSDNGSETARTNYVEIFENARDVTNGRISFTDFLSHLNPYIHRIEFIEQAEFRDLSKKMNQIYQNNVEFLVVLDQHKIISVVPVSIISDEIAKSVLRLAKEHEVT